jgi:hypothetical protein
MEWIEMGSPKCDVMMTMMMTKSIDFEAAFDRQSIDFQRPSSHPIDSVQSYSPSLLIGVSIDPNRRKSKWVTKGAASIEK